MLFANVDGKIFEIDAASGSESNFVAVFRDDAVSRVLPGEGERVERIRPAVGAAIWARPPWDLYWEDPWLVFWLQSPLRRQRQPEQIEPEMLPEP